MKAVRAILLLVLFVTFFIHPVFPQQPSVYQIYFDKGNVNWQWLGRLHYLRQWGKWRIQLRESFQSNLYRGVTVNQNWKDLNEFRFLSERTFGRSLRWGVGTTSRVLSDQTTALKFSQHTAFQQLTWTVREGIEVTPGVGWSWDESFGFRDNGPYAGLTLQLANVDLGGYQAQGRLLSNYRAFPERKNRDVSVYTSFFREFSKQASDSFTIRVGNSFNKYYLSAAGALEQVKIQEQGLRNVLRYAFSATNVLQVVTNLQRRNLFIENPFSQNQRKELILDTRARHRWVWRKLEVHSELHTAQKVQDNTGVETDITGLQTGMGVGINLRNVHRMDIAANLRYTKYEFNTPDTLVNHDDRDEQRFIFDGTVRWRMSPYFTATVNGYAYLFHQVYIHRTRSANNNWNRIFRLQAALEHRPTKNVSNVLKTEVLANYTVYDFDEILPTFKSYIFRKLIVADSLTWQFLPRVGVEGFVRLEWEDNGTFFKQLFAQQVSQQVHLSFVSLLVTYRTDWGPVLRLGGTVYRRNEWRFRPQREQTRNFVSLSPVVQVRYQTATRMAFTMEYAPTRVTDFGRVTQRFSNARLLLQYHF